MKFIYFFVVAIVGYVLGLISGRILDYSTVTATLLLIAAVLGLPALMVDIYKGKEPENCKVQGNTIEGKFEGVYVSNHIYRDRSKED